MNAAGPPIYRLAMDDNIYFLRDIATQGYRSLFDFPYLAMLRAIHREHGLKCVLNIFLSDAESRFSPRGGVLSTATSPHFSTEILFVATGLQSNRRNPVCAGGPVR